MTEDDFVLEVEAYFQRLSTMDTESLEEKPTSNLSAQDHNSETLTSAAPQSKIFFRLSDGADQIPISLQSALQSGFAAQVLELYNEYQEDEEFVIHLQEEVSREVLLIVCKFLSHHEVDPYEMIHKPLPDRQNLEMAQVCACQWDAEFIDGLDEEMLYQVILAANYMDIPALLDLALVKLALLLQNCSSFEAVKQFLGLPSTEELSSEEVVQLRRTNAWIFKFQ